MRTLDISIFELFAIIKLLAIENQTDLNNVNAFLLLELILEPKNLVGRLSRRAETKKMIVQNGTMKGETFERGENAQTVSSSSTLNSLFLPVNVLTKICMAREEPEGNCLKDLATQRARTTDGQKRSSPPERNTLCLISTRSTLFQQLKGTN